MDKSNEDSQKKDRNATEKQGSTFADEERRLNYEFGTDFYFLSNILYKK